MFVNSSYTHPMSQASPKSNNSILNAKHIHFVGIGGCGMSGIASLLHEKGFKVSGSDLYASSTTQALANQGIDVFTGHEATYCHDKDVLVVSSAIDANNPELLAAKKLNIPRLKRAEMLAHLMENEKSIAISGTHGKSTTTGLIIHLLSAASLDPSFVVGGKLNHLGKGAKLGSGQYFVAEADESDASFLHLKPDIACVTNIDADHMENFQSDLSQLKIAFCKFFQRLPPTGLALFSADDALLCQMQKNIPCPSLTYGFDKNADVYADNVHTVGLLMQFMVRSKLAADFEVILNLPGKHNVSNALCAITLALHLNITPRVIQQALANFTGISRRFDVQERSLFTKQITLIDDYGHHPKSIEVTLAAIRAAYPTRRIIHVFEPHRYTRTKALFNDFITALSSADKLILLPIFAASEKPISGISSENLACHIKGDRVEVISDFEQISTFLKRILTEGDILLIQGAGDIGALPLFLQR